MATFRSSPFPEIDHQQRQRIAAGLLVLIVLGSGVVLYVKWRSPPQIGTDPAVFKTVDALYTAVRSSDAAAIDRCEGRLSDAFAAGTLPEAAWNTLRDIIARARSGERQTAMESLYNFMLGQRRDEAALG